MMKRLLTTVPEAMKYISIIVLAQLAALVVNIVMIFIIADFAQALFLGNGNIVFLISAIIAAVLLRMLSQKIQTLAVFKSSEKVKSYFRSSLFKKVYGFGLGYINHVKPAELIQIGVEGIEQLDSFYGRFVPQLIYSILSPIVLFAFLVKVNATVAILLLVFVPLIPMAIMLVQKLAKKVMSEYWGSYINLSDRFLDNIQGLSTLKLYGADKHRGDIMDEEAENFRQATMKLLRMQIANIIVMDVVAYGGAGLGTAAALGQLQSGQLGVFGTILFILLVAEFFLPLRLLGSFFHIAMNGMASAERMFRILDIKEDDDKPRAKADKGSIVSIKNLSFEYVSGQTALKHINLEIPKKGLTAFVGPSGCGKSTLAAIISGSCKATSGSVGYGEEFGNRMNSDIAEHIAFVDASPWLFTGSVEKNLRMAAPEASDDELWEALKAVRMDGFLALRDGLKTELTEGASNLSGGQRQRLAIARVLLKKSELYIFDEATSNIDAESEVIILELMKELKKRASVILITHHISATLSSDNIVLLEKGEMTDSGSAEDLLKKKGLFASLYEEQQRLENFNSKEKEIRQTENFGNVNSFSPQKSEVVFNV